MTGVRLSGRGDKRYGAGNYNVTLSDLLIWNLETGVQGRGVWMSRFMNIRVQFANTGFEFASGFTTLQFDNCFVTECEMGYRIDGVDTVVLNTCAADKARHRAFHLANGAFVLNACHAEAEKYDHARSSVLHVEGPATVQVNGFGAYALGLQGVGDGNFDASGDRLYFLDVEANDGPAHVRMYGQRQKGTRGEAPRIRQTRFSSSNAAHARASRIVVAGGLRDIETPIDMDLPDGAQGASVLRTDAEALQPQGGQAATYDLQSSSEQRRLDVDSASVQDVARVLSTLVGDLERSGLLPGTGADGD